MTAYGTVGRLGLAGSPRVWAFIFIEQLLVNAAIAILAALELPALSRANEKAGRVVAKSNRRQLALGVTPVIYPQLDAWP